MQESNYKTASDTGEPIIHSMASCPLSLVVHPIPFGLGTKGLLYKQHLQIEAW